MSSPREVPIDVTSRHGHVSSRMEEYAIRKAERLLRFHDRISRIEIVVDGPHEAPEVEMIVHVEHGPNNVSKERDEHFSGAIDRIASKMERQLVKAKEKLKDHKGASIRDLPEAVPESPNDDEETYDEAVRRRLDS